MTVWRLFPEGYAEQTKNDAAGVKNVGGRPAAVGGGYGLGRVAWGGYRSIVATLC